MPVAESGAPLVDRLAAPPSREPLATAKAMRILHGLALACVVTALLPITFGALTTTEQAGMAVPDYPTTFGQNMVTYDMTAQPPEGAPQSRWHVFLEHTHRLGGMLIGLCCLAFFGAAMVLERRRWMKVVAALVLIGVISQGLLGGVRVLRDNTSMAMVHGFTAALFFALLAFAATATSRRWWQPARAADAIRPAGLAGTKSIAVAAAVGLLIQYSLGGALRHHGAGALLHAGFAFIAWMLLVVAAGMAIGSGLRWVRGAGVALAAVASMQVALGLAAWAAKFGVSSLGLVPGEGAAQMWLRTGHMVVGVLLVATTTLLIARTARTLQLVSQADPHNLDDAASINRPFADAHIADAHITDARLTDGATA